MNIIHTNVHGLDLIKLPECNVLAVLGLSGRKVSVNSFSSGMANELDLQSKLWLSCHHGSSAEKGWGGDE